MFLCVHVCEGLMYVWIQIGRHYMLKSCGRYVMSSQGCLYRPCFNLFWSRKCPAWCGMCMWACDCVCVCQPMKPSVRPSTNKPLREPISMYSCASSLHAHKSRGLGNGWCVCTCSPGEGSTVFQEVHKAGGYHSVHIEDQVRLLWA